MGKPLIIFDCDGVLVDSEKLLQDIDLRLIADLGWPITREEIFEQHIGRSEAAVAENIARHLGRPIPPQFMEERRATYFNAFELQLVAVSGVELAIQELQQDGFTMCIASSGSHERMKLTLGVTGLRRYFGGHIYSADDVARAKPAPDLFLHAASAMGYEPAQCVVIEDSASGVAAAHTAQMKVVGYAGLTPVRFIDSADCVIEQMNQLPKVLRGLRVA